ncbi:MAG: hypothetical protein COB23_01375 [Methylophaga sp.]|nr:MAG: hypothetical protein COB23_01375 [Methylophaga sp.]
MMDIYASDEEKGEDIKRWWREHGSSVAVGILLGVLMLLGGRYWLGYQQSVAEKASAHYQQLRTLISAEQMVEADDKIQQLFGEFSSTPYAVFAAFEMANLTLASHDISSAKSYLQWVVDNAKLSAHTDIARLRLGQLLLDESQFDQALALTNQTDLESFISLFAELRGDIYSAQGQTSEARAAYQNAVLKLSQGEPRQILLQVKLNDLAGSNDG